MSKKMTKPEIRSPKPEGGPSRFDPWILGFRLSDLFRISDFGIRIVGFAA